MAHQLLEHDTMFSVKEKPWHGLGTVVPQAPSAEEAIKLAGLDWDVELSPVSTKGNIIPGKFAILRQDTQNCLGILGKQYTPLQNKDAFKFFDIFLENDLATLETAGSLYNGAIIFILAKINSDNMIIDEKTNDIVEKYILLSNSHDGTQAVRVGYTPIRVVCNNTLSAATYSTSSKLIRVYHSKQVVQTLEEVRETMDVINQQFITTEERYKYLATKQVNKKDLEHYVRTLFSIQSLENNFQNNTALPQHEVSASRQKLINRIEEVFDIEPVHNAWTMYNAFNYYLNHEGRSNLNNRYYSLWFSDKARMDKKALKLALTY